MILFQDGQVLLQGPKGQLAIRPDDELLLKFAMLYEGECEGWGARVATEKFGYSKPRYYQLLHLFLREGIGALHSQKRGPRTHYRRTDEVIRQVIRHRFLDPDASAPVIAQKLHQTGWTISVRSVERILADFGLQKKTPYLLSSDALH